MTNPSEQELPFSEAARDAAGFAFFAANYSGECARDVWANPDRPARRAEYTAKADRILAAAVDADPRAKAFLKLAALSDEELTARVAKALLSQCDAPVEERERLRVEAREDAYVILAALGLPGRADAMSRAERVRPCPCCEGEGCSECGDTGQRVRTHIDAGDGLTFSVSGSSLLDPEAREALTALTRAAYKQTADQEPTRTRPGGER